MATHNDNTPTGKLIIRRSFQDGSSIINFPFVADIKIASRKKECRFWHVPPAESYSQACDEGMQYGLRLCPVPQNLVSAPTIGWLIKDMAKIDGDERGYAVGF